MELEMATETLKTKLVTGIHITPVSEGLGVFSLYSCVCEVLQSSLTTSSRGLLFVVLVCGKYS